MCEREKIIVLFKKENFAGCAYSKQIKCDTECVAKVYEWRCLEKISSRCVISSHFTEQLFIFFSTLMFSLLFRLWLSWMTQQLDSRALVVGVLKSACSHRGMPFMLDNYIIEQNTHSRHSSGCRLDTNGNIQQLLHENWSWKGCQIWITAGDLCRALWWEGKCSPCDKL
jgi:hypothetical protein